MFFDFIFVKKVEIVHKNQHYLQGRAECRTLRAFEVRRPDIDTRFPRPGWTVKHRVQTAQKATVATLYTHTC